MKSEEKVVFERVVPGKHSLVFSVKTGQHVRITDIEGQQIVDFVCFNEKDYKEKLDVLRTFIHNDFNSRIGRGNILYSNRSNAMFTIVEDTCGVHDLWYTECDQMVYKEWLKWPSGAPTGPYDGCFEILTKALKQYGITADDIPGSFNINMKTREDIKTGKYQIELPESKPGDYTEMRAEMDLLVALDACPEELTPANGGRSTPIKVEVIERVEVLALPWKEELRDLLLPEHTKKVLATLDLGKREEWSPKEIVDLLTLRKQLFKGEFKRWIRAKIKTEEDLEKLSVTLAELV